MDRADTTTAPLLDLYRNRLNFFFPGEIVRFEYFETLLKQSPKERYILVDSIDAEKSRKDGLVECLAVLDAEAVVVTASLTAARGELEAHGEAFSVAQGQIQRLSTLPQPAQRDLSHVQYLVDRNHHTASDVRNVSGILAEKLPLAPPPALPVKKNAVPTTARAIKRPPIRPSSHSPSPAASSTNISSKTSELVNIEHRLTFETARAHGALGRFDDKMADLQATMARGRASSSSMLDVDKNEVEQLITETTHLEQQCYLAVTELLKLRSKITKTQREEFEALDALALTKAHFDAQERAVAARLEAETKDVTSRLHTQVECAEADFAARCAEADARFDAAVAAGQEALSEGRRAKAAATATRLESELEAANAKVRGQPIQTVSYPQLSPTLPRSQLILANAKVRKLHKRFMLELEGFDSEASILRQRLKKAVMQRKRATDRRRTATATTTATATATTTSNAHTAVFAATYPPPRGAAARRATSTHTSSPGSSQGSAGDCWWHSPSHARRGAAVGSAAATLIGDLRRPGHGSAGGAHHDDEGLSDFDLRLLDLDLDFELLPAPPPYREHRDSGSPMPVDRAGNAMAEADGRHLLPRDVPFP